MTINEAQITAIGYLNESKNEVTARTIIPMSVPKDSVRAIDVSGLTEGEQQVMASLVAEYKSYMSDVMSNSFKFEDWAEHTKCLSIQPKWRTFKLANISIGE